MDTWTTAHVVKLTGVTARTLRHYDAIGLLPPAAGGRGGQRRYGRAELLRLQQILLLKRLGLRLDVIAGILEGGLDPAEALRRHAEGIAAEQERLARLADTVDATIRQLETGGPPMAPDTWFRGLDDRDRHREEARRRWGQAVVERAFAALQRLTPEQRRALPAESGRINAALEAHRRAGHGPGDGAVQEVLAGHYRLIARHWDGEPGAEAYRRLAAFYTDDPRFREPFDRVGDGFAEYLREAMHRYADTALAARP